MHASGRRNYPVEHGIGTHVTKKHGADHIKHTAHFYALFRVNGPGNYKASHEEPYQDGCSYAVSRVSQNEKKSQHPEDRDDLNIVILNPSRPIDIVRDLHLVEFRIGVQHSRGEVNRVLKPGLAYDHSQIGMPVLRKDHDGTNNHNR